MKRIISFVCMVALMLTMFVCAGTSVYAADSEFDVSVKFNRYEMKSETPYLFVDVELSIPELSALVDEGEDDYAWYGKVMNSLSWGIAFDSEKLTFNAKNTTQASVAKAQASGSNVKVAWADTDYEKWYAGENPVWTLAFKVLDTSYAPVFSVNPGDTAAAIVTFAGENAATPTDDNTVVYKATIKEAAGNEVPISYSVASMQSYDELNAPVEPEVPTAADLGLFTDATQNAKVTEKVMTSNGWSIEKALLFVSGINNDAAVVSYGTEITCEGYDKVLDIPCVNSYEASETVKGFVAAVSSIRNNNLTKTFTAKAYADVTVGEDTVRIYATDAATAVYGN